MSLLFKITFKDGNVEEITLSVNLAHNVAQSLANFIDAGTKTLMMQYDAVSVQYLRKA